jgi:hypothetical protein
MASSPHSVTAGGGCAHPQAAAPLARKRGVGPPLERTQRESPPAAAPPAPQDRNNTTDAQAHHTSSSQSHHHHHLIIIIATTTAATTATTTAIAIITIHDAIGWPGSFAQMNNPSLEDEDVPAWNWKPDGPPPWCSRSDREPWVADASSPPPSQSPRTHDTL